MSENNPDIHQKMKGTTWQGAPFQPRFTAGVNPYKSKTSPVQTAPIWCSESLCRSLFRDYGARRRRTRLGLAGGRAAGAGRALL